MVLSEGDNLILFSACVSKEDVVTSFVPFEVIKRAHLHRRSDEAQGVVPSLHVKQAI